MLCLSTFYHDTQSHSSSPKTKDQSSSYHPLLANPAMVPSSSRDVHRFPSLPISISSTTLGSYGQFSQPSSSRSITPFSLVNLGNRRTTDELLEISQFLISEAWAPGTKSCYRSCWSLWVRWCLERNLDPFYSDLNSIINFLSSCYQQGKAYRTINCYRSAISASHDFINGFPVGKHPLVCKLMKGIRISRPPSSRYSNLWDVNQVLSFLESWPSNEHLSLKQLSAKLSMLLCLISFRRVSDIHALDITNRSYEPNGVRFRIFRRTKSSSREIFYPNFPQNPQLCVVLCLKMYELVTSTIRPLNAHQLLISFVKPFLPVSSATLARWIRWVMSSAGIDISRFGAHSSRGAMASKSLVSGGRLEDILKAADWSNESTFKTFYFKPLDHAAFNVIQQL
ncbi:uncharacterized protein WCC33_017757 [Rhinophrynus dorsalis]